ncbi:hypothetical protein MTBLM1_140001 [Rhodospirillaceae bacterium LM-1]|nr:hypothetical protein MTBLM1_140001 [Rhodospirillaceae bacterium LM-1]
MPIRFLQLLYEGFNVTEHTMLFSPVNMRDEPFLLLLVSCFPPSSQNKR